MKDMILEKKIGSVVIIDKDNHPVGIITTRDFLRLINQASKFEKIEEITNNLSYESSRIISGFFNNLAFWVKRFPKLSKFKLFF